MGCCSRATTSAASACAAAMSCSLPCCMPVQQLQVRGLVGMLNPSQIAVHMLVFMLSCQNRSSMQQQLTSS